MCYKCLYIFLAIITGVLFYIFVPSEYWSEWITAISTLAMAIIAGRALGTWKKEIEYQFISDLRKDLIKALANLYYSLDLHANNYATSDNTLKQDTSNFNYEKEKIKIENEFADKQREVSKAIYSYILYRPNQKTFLENLTNKLNEYRNNVLDLINIRIQIQQSRKNDESLDYPTENKIKEKIKNNQAECEKLMNKLKVLTKE